MSAACPQLPPSGLSPEHYNYLKCWVVLNHQGREIFEQIFIWGFKRSPSEIKVALFELPNYSNKLYRSDFNASQREKIESGKLAEFDLGLFYPLLQKVCSLPSSDNKQWGREGDSSSLPNMLYRIKMKRNALAHNSIEMEEKELFFEIDEMRHLFIASLDAAAVIYAIDNTELNEIKDKINHSINSVLNSSQQVIVESVKEVILTDNDLGLSESETKLAKTFRPLFKSILTSKIVTKKVGDWEKLQEPAVKKTTQSIIERGENLFKESEKLIKEIKWSPNDLEKISSIAKEAEPLVKEAQPVIKEAANTLKRLFKF